MHKVSALRKEVRPFHEKKKATALLHVAHIISTFPELEVGADLVARLGFSPGHLAVRVLLSTHDQLGLKYQA